MENSIPLTADESANIRDANNRIARLTLRDQLTEASTEEGIDWDVIITLLDPVNLVATHWPPSQAAAATLAGIGRPETQNMLLSLYAVTQQLAGLDPEARIEKWRSEDRHVLACLVLVRFGSPATHPEWYLMAADLRRHLTAEEWLLIAGEIRRALEAIDWCYSIRDIVKNPPSGGE